MARTEDISPTPVVPDPPSEPPKRGATAKKRGGDLTQLELRSASNTKGRQGWRTSFL